MTDHGHLGDIIGMGNAKHPPRLVVWFRVVVEYFKLVAMHFLKYNVMIGLDLQLHSHVYVSQLFYNCSCNI